ncbi:uncharacterized protein LOC132285571 isoform X1 [Cornus florida]|uniref:uncharacterized protein LOC132285571 isoform X1 n=1 Tax=Cornus florida TaxID=4283 RepID=UPI00289C8EA4|nr:uncharacterized protein LOC132285571 isoform X1 [Cornus florida]
MAVTGLPTICSSLFFALRRPKASRTATRIAFGVPNLFPATTPTLTHVVRASEPQREQQVNDSDPATFTSPSRLYLAFSLSKQELNYLWKLGVGSVAGAAAIKYGSILFPEITRPNILLALIMISAPVIVAVLLLIKHSRDQ